MAILLDTNVYLYAIQSEEGAALFERQFLPLVFQTYLASIVVESFTLERLIDKPFGSSKGMPEFLNESVA